MRELRPDALRVRFLDGLTSDDFSLPRCYTLTHSDRTGHLFLGIGKEFYQVQISGLYTRLMSAEVLAEWRGVDGVYQLHVLCHVSGGGCLWQRQGIFRQHMRLVLEALRHGRLEGHAGARGRLEEQVGEDAPIQHFRELLPSGVGDHLLRKIKNELYLLPRQVADGDDVQAFEFHANRATNDRRGYLTSS